MSASTTRMGKRKRDLAGNAYDIRGDLGSSGSVSSAHDCHRYMCFDPVARRSLRLRGSKHYVNSTIIKVTLECGIIACPPHALPSFGCDAPTCVRSCAERSLIISVRRVRQQKEINTFCSLYTRASSVLVCSLEVLGVLFSLRSQMPSQHQHVPSVGGGSCPLPLPLDKKKYTRYNLHPTVGYITPNPTHRKGCRLHVCVSQESYVSKSSLNTLSSRQGRML